MQLSDLLRLIDSCFFFDGYMQGDVAKRVENIDSEDSCAIHVRDNYPDATGATWYLNTSCWAEYGKYDFRSSLHRTCHFTGWISLGNLLDLFAFGLII